MFIFRFDTGLSIGELEEDMTIPIIPHDTHPQLLTFTGKILVSIVDLPTILRRFHAKRLSIIVAQ